jgi:methionine--tRNA ligase beta chain
MEPISIDDFQKAELRIAKIVRAERVSGSDKLICLYADLGEKDAAGLPRLRQIVAGIGKNYTPEELVGKSIVVVANLEPRQLMGLESQGMLLAATCESGLPALLVPEKDVPPGSAVK